MSTKRLLILLALLIGTLYASDAHAQACTISATSVNFGSYNVFNGSDTDSTGTLLGLLCLNRTRQRFCTEADVRARAADQRGTLRGAGQRK